MVVLQVNEVHCTTDLLLLHFDLLHDMGAHQVVGRDHSDAEARFRFVEVDDSHYALPQECSILYAYYLVAGRPLDEIRPVIFQVISDEIVLGHVVELGLGGPLGEAASLAANTGGEDFLGFYLFLLDLFHGS